MPIGRRRTLLHLTLPAAGAVSAAVVPSARAGGPVLDCPSTSAEGDGYGGYAWTGMTADLDAAAAAAGGVVATATDLSDLSALEAYTGVWVDVRQPGTGTFAAGEAAALSAYVATGRRVVLVGGAAASFPTWDAALLNLVGGTDTGTVRQTTAAASSAAASPLTAGVSSVYSAYGDTAASGASTGTPLFYPAVATVWGPARNVALLLDDNVPGDDAAGRASNAAFDQNLAAWVTGRAADPAVRWAATSGGAWQAGGSWLPGAMPAVADAAVFDLSSTYTAAVAGPVTAESVTVRTDRLTLDFPTAAGGLAVGGAVAVAASAGQAASLALTHSAGGGTAVVLAGTVTLGTGGSLSVGAGTQLAVAGAVSAAGPVMVAGRLSVGATSRVAGLSVAPGGRVDLGSADLIDDGGNVAAVSGWAATAFDGGAWDGPGLTASAAAADPRHLTAVGVIANVGPAGAALYTSFDGQPVTAADVLVRTTVYGDANLDGTVDAADYLRVDVGYFNHLSGWANGDFNYDGVVDGSDYTLMDNAFDQAATTRAVAAAEVAAVPEPATAGITLTAVVALLGRRPKRVPPARGGGVGRH